MKRFILPLLISMVASISVLAGIDQAPPSFTYDGQKVVWTDFQTAEYEIVYDVKKRKAFTKSVITFTNLEEGFPLYDSVTPPTNIYVNGIESSQKLIGVPGRITKVRMVNTKLAPGTHMMVILTPLKNGTFFKRKKVRGRATKVGVNVSSAFFIRDLTGRKFLEQYLPTNFEYDQYTMIMDVRVNRTSTSHSLFVNGKVLKMGKNHWRVKFPNWYSTSSVFFHLVPRKKFVRYRLTFPSIDGRNIPVIIYSNWSWYNKMAKTKAWSVLKELEADYGPWPHDKVIIYGTGLKGGMEYAGATETSITSLGHELQHSYFAKGLQPADGNSGWMDEGIASWRDKGHQTHSTPNYSSYNLGAHSVYKRSTDKASYAKGRSFFSYIDYQLKAVGKEGLKHFLRGYFAARKYTTVTTEIFRADLEAYAGLSFKEDFGRYIYGANGLEMGFSEEEENPHHPIVTQEQLDSII